MAGVVIMSVILVIITASLSSLVSGQDSCQLTIQVDAADIQGVCNSTPPPQGLINQEVQNLKQDNLKLKEDLEEMRKEYQAMVETVKKLNQETASWREIVEWPLLDAVFRPDNSTMYIDPDGPSYEDCTEAVASKRKQGIYSLQPAGTDRPFPGYCTEDGWTVIQRRFNGNVSFYREWDEYMKGFGRLGGEFWLGLENIHHITNQDRYEVKIEALGYNGKLYHSVNPDFRVMGEKDKYMLLVGNMTDGNYKDLVAELNGTAFTAKDEDNDEWWDNNCAYHYRGGFWLKNCGYDLNREYCDGRGCMSFGERTIKKSMMMVRPSGSQGNSRPSNKPNKPKKPKKPKQRRQGNRG